LKDQTDAIKAQLEAHPPTPDTTEPESDEPEVVVKKRAKKKPIVIIEQSDSESDDEQVVYIKRKPKPRTILQEEPLIETPTAPHPKPAFHPITLMRRKNY
jgi:hypothetical protein